MWRMIYSSPSVDKKLPSSKGSCWLSSETELGLGTTRRT